MNRIRGVMSSMFASSTVNHGFQSRSRQNIDYKLKIVICYYYTKLVAVRSKSSDWLTRN